MTTAHASEKAVILVVDDTPSNLHVLIDALNNDYEVMIATSGKQALAIVSQQEKPDLILLDVMMPDMDGFQVCQALKADSLVRDIPVIFITALADPVHEAKGLEIGAVDYITKPIRLPIVRARVRTHLKLKHHMDMLASMAMLDGLTGIANRRNFDLMLDIEWKRAIREHLPLSVLMADIDTFKTYNDCYGHGAGDDVLRRVAKELEETAARPSDFAARYGGEEFVLILPNTPRSGAFRLATRFLERVSGLAIPHQASSVCDHVTVSVGGVTVLPNASLTAQMTVDLADQLLYRAKREGRNRVVWSDWEGTELSSGKP